MKNKDEVFIKFKELTTQKRRSRTFDQIMVENSHQINSKSYAEIHGLRGSYPLHIIHNRMEL